MTDESQASVTKQDLTEIRALYQEAQAFLSQLPQPRQPMDYIAARQSWQNWNNLLESIQDTTGDNLKRYYVQPERGEDLVRLVVFRGIVHQIINRLHAKYFHQEQMPFGAPSSNITFSQSQSQTAYVQLLVDLVSVMDAKLQGYSPDSPENKWWASLKQKLGTAVTVADLVAKILGTAKTAGLDLETLGKLFS
jgi:hypothetical protein